MPPLKMGPKMGGTIGLVNRQQRRRQARSAAKTQTAARVERPTQDQVRAAVHSDPLSGSDRPGSPLDEAAPPPEVSPSVLRARAINRLRYLRRTLEQLERERPGVLRQARAAGLSWDEISREAGVPRETLRRWSQKRP